MRALGVLCLLAALAPAPAAASLIGDAIVGELNFDGFSGNWFDPLDHPGNQLGGTVPGATVADPDAGPFFAEYVYTDGACGLCRTNISVDVDAASITLRQFLINPASPAGPVGAFDIYLTDLDWPGGTLPGVVIASSSFLGGLTAELTGPDAIHLRYEGGDPIPVGTELAASITIAPEPAALLLLGSGLAALAVSRRRRAAP